MSAQQLTLDGGPIEPQKDEGEPKNGWSLVLWHASPDTDWDKLAEWHRRLEAEGCL